MARVEEMVMPVRLDEKTFRRFARFDVLILRRQWLRPAAFALILTAFAVVAFMSGRPQSGLLGGVLLAVGLGLPAVYIGTFLAQVSRQARLQKLKPPRLVYQVTLDGKGVRVTNRAKEEEPLLVDWEKIPVAIRVRDAIYLYVAPSRAFLLPEGSGGYTGDKVWAALRERLGEGKCRDRRLLKRA